MMRDYGFKEYRRLYVEDLRNLCIKENWYTRGTNEEYQAMLDSVPLGDIKLKDIISIALDIERHSDIDYSFAVEYEDYENIEIICNFILGVCDTRIVRVNDLFGNLDISDLVAERGFSGYKSLKFLGKIRSREDEETPISLMEVFDLVDNICFSFLTAEEKKVTWKNK